MNMNAVSPSQFRRLAGADASRVTAILKEPGMGVALFVDSDNRKLLMSYGTWKAQIPHRVPPGSVGEMTLRAYCPPGEAGPQEMVSPLLLGVRRQQEDTYQIPTRPWSEQGSRTELPGDRMASTPSCPRSGSSRNRCRGGSRSLMNASRRRPLLRPNRLPSPRPA
jgi:hypothetical protein